MAGADSADKLDKAVVVVNPVEEVCKGPLCFVAEEDETD